MKKLLLPFSLCKFSNDVYFLKTFIGNYTVSMIIRHSDNNYMIRFYKIELINYNINYNSFEEAQSAAIKELEIFGYELISKERAEKLRLMK
jgi:hypothetical protein